MLNLMSVANFEWAADWRFWLMLSAVLFIAAVLVTVAVLKKKIGKDYTKIGLIVSGVIGIVSIFSVIVYSLVEAAKDGKFGAGYSMWVLAGVLIFVMLIILAICFIDFSKGKKNNTVALVYAAVCIALSFALSYVRFFKMPQGGSITLASLLPIALYSYIFGVRRGIICCFIYGLLQVVQDPWIVHPIQAILDYPLAFMLIGLAGCLKKPLAKYPQVAIVIGILFGVVVRYICHVLSGSIYFASSAPEGMNAWIYSLGYNSFVFVDGAITMIAAALLLCSKQMLREVGRINQKYLNGNNIIAEPPVADAVCQNSADKVTEDVNGDTNSDCGNVDSDTDK